VGRVMGLLGAFAVIWLIFKIIKEQYDIKNPDSKYNRDARKYLEEQDKRFGREPFEERMKHIVEESNKRQGK
jgi:hypothetical protein